ncbi:hypothetical protein ACFVQ0_28560 [Streptomyces sp. NPDC057900]|uniref:hypothetical protein n=1 Tax=Streptomyces sp. NPDC057900 TaxID=3346274 RepID=UPI0036E27D10
MLVVAGEVARRDRRGVLPGAVGRGEFLLAVEAVAVDVGVQGDFTVAPADQEIVGPLVTGRVATTGYGSGVLPQIFSA